MRGFVVETLAPGVRFMRPLPAMKCEACGHENLDGARFCAGCGVQLPSMADVGADPLIGQIIGGRFKVTGILGEGGMGIVYCGEQPMGSTVRKVAIKTLHQHLSKDPSVLARFHRECGTVAQLEHPNTIKVYDFGSTDDGTLYIAMEFVSGAPISDIIEKQGPMSADRVVKVMRQVCGALEEAHQQGIIHRDLKPENIVLTERAGETDFAKVLDFGIAGRTESGDAQKEQKLTQQGMVLGTPPYMSPEQFTGKALDGRSDVYSLAVVAYEMLTGRLPFDAETPWEWATQHMTAQPKPLEEVVSANMNVPEHLRLAIMKALSKDREHRQATVRELFQELSDGERMTVERPAAFAAEVGSAATAAMPVAPAFSPGGVAPTAAMPHVPAAGLGSPPPSGGALIGAAHPIGAVPAVAAPMPSTAKPRSGKGLVIGLVALAGVVGVVMLVVLLKSSKPEEEYVLGGPLGGEATSSAQASIAPIVTGDDTPPTTGETIAANAKDTEPASGKLSTVSGSNKPVSGSGQTTTTSQSTTTSGTQNPTSGQSNTTAPNTGPTQPPATGNQTTTPANNAGGASDPAACTKCIAAANSGNIQGALTQYQRCSDAGKKSQCQRIAGVRAPAAAKRQANNGNCSGARAIVNGAKAMGASSPGLDTALAGTSCQ